MEFRIGFSVRILVAPSVFIVVCAIPLEQACGGFTCESFWEELFGRPVRGKLHLGAMISCIPLFDCGRNGLPPLSLQGMMFEPCALTR
jgi:hypothetical protein